MTFVEVRGLPTREELAERPHGTRLRYIGGCRCVPCRAANSRYECERLAARKRGEWNGVVDAEPARRHLVALARAGVGYRSVAEASGVARGVVAAVKTGKRTRVRAMTVQRILAVDSRARAGGVIVGAADTWRRVRALLAEGYSKARIAREIGQRGGGLQIGPRRVTLETATKVERAFARLTR